YSVQAANLLTELKVGYYCPTGHKFRKIYSGAAITGIETSYQAWRDLYVWGSASYLYKEGRSIGDHHSTHITLVPVGLGLKYLYSLRPEKPCPIDLYLGAGVLGTYVNIRDKSPFVIPRSSGWSCGGIIKGGMLFDVTKCLFLDFYTDY